MEIRGRIVDENNVPLEKALLYVTDRKGNRLKPLRGTQTDVNGEFVLSAGPDEFVTVTYITYKPRTFRVGDYYLGPSDRKIFPLTPKESITDVVEIIAKAPEYVEKKPWVLPLVIGILIILFGLVIHFVERRTGAESTAVAVQ